MKKPPHSQILANRTKKTRRRLLFETTSKKHAMAALLGRWQSKNMRWRLFFGDVEPKTCDVGSFSTTLNQKHAMAALLGR